MILSPIRMWIFTVLASGVDLLGATAPLLNPPQAGRHDEPLPNLRERV
jgi:hypothetical protein